MGARLIHPDEPTPQPIIYKNMFGAYGKAKFKTCITFMSKSSIEAGVPEKLGLEKIVLPVSNCRDITKHDLLLNDATPHIEVDPETYQVTVDGQIISSNVAETLPMTQLYYLF